ncbi:MAG: tetratricopeptide repeat protein, partial [Verrucomicrobiota bacterium]
MDKTLKVLENALQSDPENWETRRHLVELLYEQGEGEQAGELLTEAPEIPATEEDQLFAAQVFLEHDAANAMLCIDAVLKQNSGSAAAHLLKAHFYRQTNQKRNAGKHYTTATVLDASLKDPELADWLAGAPAKGADEPAATAASAAKASPPPVPKRARGKKKGGRQETKPEPDVEEEAVPAIEETAPEPVAEEIEETVEAEVDTASVSEEATPVETETGSSQPALATGARASVTDQAAERIEKGLDSEKKQKSVLAFGVALLLHVLLAVAFYKLVIQNDGGKSPDLVISAGTGEVENEARMREFQQNIPQKP